MRSFGLENDFYYDINKYLSNRENDFRLYNTYITILYYGLSQIKNSYSFLALTFFWLCTFKTHMRVLPPSVPAGSSQPHCAGSHAFWKNIYID